MRPERPPVSISTAALNPSDIANRSFTIVRRGYDPDAVRRFLEEVAAVVRAEADRHLELRSLLADAEQRAANPRLDEATLTTAVGVETARVLQAAHEAARDVLARADAQVAEMTGRVESELEERSTAAEVEALAIRERAELEAAGLREEAERYAQALRERTTAECRTMLDEAKAARRRVLADLALRRRSLHLQLEALRAGKDALAGVVDSVAETVDGLRARLAGAEEEARIAADDAALHVAPEASLGALDELAALSDELVAETFLAAEAAAAGTSVTPDGAADADGEASEPAPADQTGAITEPVPAGEAKAAPAGEVEGSPTEQAEAVPAGGADGSETEQAAVAPAGGVEGSPTEQAEAASAGGAVGSLTEQAEGAPTEQAEAAPAGRTGALAAGGSEAATDGATGAAAGAGTAGAAPDGERGAPVAGEGAEQPRGGSRGGHPSQGLAIAGAPAVAEAEGSADTSGSAGEDVQVGGEGAHGSGSGPGSETVPSAPAGVGGRSKSNVDELFARIRATRAGEVASARAVLAGTASDEGAVDGPVVGGAEADEFGAPESGAGREPGEEGHVTAAPERALLERRDELVAPSQDELSRRLKRALLEQQNELLDALRHRKRDEDAFAIVSGAAGTDALAAAAGPSLVAAYAAGVAFAAEAAGRGEPEVTTLPGAGEAGTVAATELATDVATHLSSRFEQGLSELAGDESALPALVGAAYREWKGERVERLSAEYANRAFADGVLAAVSAAGGPLRWVVDDGAEACPDCDDNEIAGPQAAGEPFPTGHVRPPAHPGCRCLLVPLPA